MSDLLKVFDSYLDFNRGAYFTFCFDTIPSEVRLRLPLQDSKTNMEKALNLVDWKHFGFEIIAKDWNTEDASNSDFSKDYPYRYLYKAKNKSIIIWWELISSELDVIFLYDVADEELEKWVLETNHKIRTELGINRAPLFKVLSKRQNNFDTEDVRTEAPDIDISKMYNDDFQEVDDLIKDSFENEKSGLILLHGHPGTGKTTYIKNLITTYNTRDFIFIQNDFIKELLHPNFISFLLRHRNSVLIIEDAEKVITTRDYTNENSVVSTVLQLTDGLFSDYLNIKIICTFNTSIDKVDKALLRKGRMIASYEFKPLSLSKTNQLLDSLGHSAQDDEMVLADIYNLKQKVFQNINPNKIGF